MEPRETVAAALALAERQLALVRGGDIDGFVAGAEEHDRACGDVTAIPPVDDPVLVERIQQLILTNEAVAAGLASAMKAASDRLEAMHRGRRVAGAYLATPSPEAFARRDG
jgi:hypothetical protein